MSMNCWWNRELQLTFIAVDMAVIAVRCVVVHVEM